MTSRVEPSLYLAVTFSCRVDFGASSTSRGVTSMPTSFGSSAVLRGMPVGDPAANRFVVRAARLEPLAAAVRREAGRL